MLFAASELKRCACAERRLFALRVGLGGLLGALMLAALALCNLMKSFRGSMSGARGC
ncbi:MAG: hypothetical protein ACLUI3_13835 [Christensenellales bacterium]